MSNIFPCFTTYQITVNDVTEYFIGENINFLAKSKFITDVQR